MKQIKNIVKSTITSIIVQLLLYINLIYIFFNLIFVVLQLMWNISIEKKRFKSYNIELNKKFIRKALNHNEYYKWK